MQIVPIRDLRNTNEISERCRQSAEPIFVTKNGYGDMVIMSMETYERTVAMAEVYRKLMQAEAEMDAGKAIDGEAAFLPRWKARVQIKDVPIQTDAIRRPGSAGNRGLYCGAVEARRRGTIRLLKKWRKRSGRPIAFRYPFRW